MWTAEVEVERDWAVAVRAGGAGERAVAVGAREAERGWAVAARVGEAARGLRVVAATVEAMEEERDLAAAVRARAAVVAAMAM